ncbi:26S proteasome complex subunit DSS1 [Kwoniella heveanensis CBS 569]|uniref:26S proteasome complex subunit SEM1 n=1 Tax=Kwoniella heveanensis BCC8398 TaxID=1296120 RepID=A0A1B9GVI8_9TREE|nr:26S proteasome complex subunit DSS1 [Kwoniella heveanensis BCC8398]OCF40286.1 26S proteasome complex subunit DSS1 [Kwoniella heveanensis CBS 569]
MSDKQNNAAAGSSSTPDANANVKNGSGSQQQTEKKALPKLGALEDDDEFEDFPATDYGGNVLDAMKKAGDGPNDNLWEDNWDDDDVEDDFTKQLRTAIQERSGAPADEAMKE